MKKNKIRDRVSYFFWRNIVSAFGRSHEARAICARVWEEMDNRMLFNSEQQANWDKESMELALDDVFFQKTP